MNSIAFSLLANGSSEFNGSQETELTIGSLNIIIESSGSSCLSNSTKPDPSAKKSKTKETLESSQGSSSEVNSLVSLAKVSIAEGNKNQENFDSEEKAYQTHSNAEDLAIGSSGVSNYISYVSLSLKQKKKTTAKEVRRSTGKSTK
jgi:hypothetical protein